MARTEIVMDLPCTISTNTSRDMQQVLLGCQVTFVANLFDA
jgi:hypothetical protein